MITPVVSIIGLAILRLGVPFVSVILLGIVARRIDQAFPVTT
ncbi:MAG: hypothetical protein U9R25_10655 [Chloroflexota bacterium]|nr:hypothetical protein [Chloroflexota bacterium]